MVPTITTSPILTNTTTIDGTVTAASTNQKIYLFANSTQIGNTTTSTTSWSVTGLSLTQGDTIRAYAVKSGECLSVASAYSLVSRKSLAPELLGAYCITGTLTPPDSIYGTSAEAPGTIITVYKNGGAITPTTTVRSNYTWGISTGAWSFSPSDIITAKATITGGLISDASNAITVGSKTTSSVAITTDPIIEGTTTIEGTGTNNTDVVRLYVDDIQVGGTTTVSGGTWTLSGLNSFDLYAGGIVTAKVTAGANCESNSSPSKTVICQEPADGLSVDPTDTTICSGSLVANVKIYSSESLVIYQLYSQGSPTGSSVLGTGGTITLNSGNLTSTTKLAVRAIKLGGPACESALTDSVPVTVNAIPTGTIGATSPICVGENTTLTFTLTGVSNWTVKYSDGTTTFTESAISSSSFTKNVVPAANTTYTLTEISDINCTNTSP